MVSARLNPIFNSQMCQQWQVVGSFVHRHCARYPDRSPKYVLHQNERAELMTTVISIPIALLWNVKIKPRQKCALLASLCLSIIMVALCVVRIAGMRLPQHNAIDFLWSIFWAQLNGCVAILLISITAFRSLFVVDGSRNSGEKKPLNTSREKFWRRRQASNEKPDMGLPMIPRAMLTGMRTFIGGPRDTDRDPGTSFADDFGPWPTNNDLQYPHDVRKRPHSPVMDFDSQHAPRHGKNGSQSSSGEDSVSRMESEPVSCARVRDSKGRS